MKYLQFVCVSVLLVLGGCSLVSEGSSIDRAAARKVADSFMADLVADRVDLALDKLAASLVQRMGKLLTPQSADNGG
jgi:hypothetical protein